MRNSFKTPPVKAAYGDRKARGISPVNIDQSLHGLAKRYAESHGVPIVSVIETAVSDYLSDRGLAVPDLPVLKG